MHGQAHTHARVFAVNVTRPQAVLVRRGARRTVPGCGGEKGALRIPGNTDWEDGIGHGGGGARRRRSQAQVPPRSSSRPVREGPGSPLTTPGSRTGDWPPTRSHTLAAGSLVPGCWTWLGNSSCAAGGAAGIARPFLAPSAFSCHRNLLPRYLSSPLLPLSNPHVPHQGAPRGLR